MTRVEGQPGKDEEWKTHAGAFFEVWGFGLILFQIFLSRLNYTSIIPSSSPPTWTLWRPQACQCSWSPACIPCIPWRHIRPWSSVSGGQWWTWQVRSATGWQLLQTRRFPLPYRVQPHTGWNLNLNKSSCCKPDKPRRRRSKEYKETVKRVFLGQLFTFSTSLELNYFSSSHINTLPDSFGHLVMEETA